MNDLVLKPGSKLNYVSIQEWSGNFVSIQVNSTVAAKDSAALNLALNFGGKYSRLESVSRMIDSGARSDMLAISVARDEQEFDQRTLAGPSKTGYDQRSALQECAPRPVTHDFFRA